jgi:hypothetical protein
MDDVLAIWITFELFILILVVGVVLEEEVDDGVGEIKEFVGDVDVFVDDKVFVVTLTAALIAAAAFKASTLVKLKLHKLFKLNVGA